MKILSLSVDFESFGITRKSLRMLRNAICENINSELLIIEVPTSDICCGFFIFSCHKGSSMCKCTWTGDGFRLDGGGEGGRGYDSAQKMLSFFGLSSHNIYDEETLKQVMEEWERIHKIMDEDDKKKKEILSLAQKILDEFIDGDDNLFKSVYETYPHY